MNFLLDILKETWILFQDASIYIIFGLFISGLIKSFISTENILKSMGAQRLRSVINASLIGIPLPLCSCGVVPTAVSLRKRGASKGATVSFLISTPESGIDSIAITYALMDIVITIFRPIAAFLTALVAGIIENIFGKKDEILKSIDLAQCPIENCENGDINHKHSIKEKLLHGLEYSFVELVGDIALWLIIGFLIAGIISYLIPEDFFTHYFGNGFLSMLVMLLIGLPLYICASASTPIASALILKGLSPGAALVFLLAGPATNATSVTMLTKYLGKRTMITYIITIALMSILMGTILNFVYQFLGIDPHAVIGKAREVFSKETKMIFSILMITLLVVGIVHEIKENRSGALDS